MALEDDLRASVIIFRVDKSKSEMIADHGWKQILANLNKEKYKWGALFGARITKNFCSFKLNEKDPNLYKGFFTRTRTIDCHWINNSSRTSVIKWNICILVNFLIPAFLLLENLKWRLITVELVIYGHRNTGQK